VRGSYIIINTSLILLSSFYFHFRSPSTDSSSRSRSSSSSRSRSRSCSPRHRQRSTRSRSFSPFIPTVRPPAQRSATPPLSTAAPDKSEPLRKSPSHKASSPDRAAHDEGVVFTRWVVVTLASTES